MISGGADRLEETFFKVQERFGPFARDEASRPFDRHRGGFVLGEAGALLLFEAADAAAARGARVYGELLGVGMTASRAELNGWPLDSSGTARAMQMALDDAEVSSGGDRRRVRRGERVEAAGCARSRGDSHGVRPARGAGGLAEGRDRRIGSRRRRGSRRWRC